MTKLTMVILISILTVLLSISAFAQSTATASTTAIIVAPIGITKIVDMNFGNVIVDATAGTVELSTINSRSFTGGAAGASGITPTAAMFTVTGSGSFTYTISLPAAPITLTGTTAGVTVGSFISNPTSPGTLSSGTQDVYVGATLNLPVGGVIPDTYNNGSGLEVIVNYN
jgi:hypothetical protein